MHQSIAFPVGKGGTNLPEDVALIAQMLNRVPTYKGGPSVYPGAQGSMTGDVINAIIHFQQAQSIFPVNGLITKESPTLFRLNQLANDAAAGDRHVQGMRQKVCDFALSYSRMNPVSDLICTTGIEFTRYFATQGKKNIPTPEALELQKIDKGNLPFRKGGEFLKKLYDDILLIPIDWSDQKPYKFHSKFTFKTHEITMLEGVFKRHMRVPLRNAANGGVHWCGMFACWIWKQAGIDIKWQVSREPLVSGKPLKPRTDKENMRHGDIAMIPEESHHYLIVSDPPSTKPMTALHTVDGNDMWQQILEHKPGAFDDGNKHTFGHVVGYYSLAEALGAL
ncbi:MAG: hypothetical protein JNK48_15290 [Bryobacterales bacterium]|nr:hypothetical protein [Bryobacterales bacterium]